MAFEIARGDTDQFARLIAHDDVQGHPSGPLADTARFLERGQEGVGNKRIVRARTGIPFACRQCRQERHDTDLEGGRIVIHHAHGWSRSG